MLCHRALLFVDILDTILASNVFFPYELALAALVHTSWRRCAQRALYRRIYTCQPCYRLARTMEGSPYLRGLVKDLTLLVHEIDESYGWVLENSLHWLRSANLRTLVVLLSDGISKEIFTRHVQSWDMPSLLLVCVDGCAFPIPRSVKSLSLIARTDFEPRYLPPYLEELTIIRATGIPLDMINHCRATLTHLHIVFDSWQPSHLHDPNSRDMAWDWPCRNSIHSLTLVSSFPLYLKVDSTRLSPRILRISVCLLEANNFPRSVETLELAAPGVFDMDLVPILLGTGEGEPPISKLTKVHIATAFDYRAAVALDDHGIIVTTSERFRSFAYVCP